MNKQNIYSSWQFKSNTTFLYFSFYEQLMFHVEQQLPATKPRNRRDPKLPLSEWAVWSGYSLFSFWQAGGLNAFYWYQIFALDSTVVEVQEMFS